MQPPPDPRPPLTAERVRELESELEFVGVSVPLKVGEWPIGTVMEMRHLLTVARAFEHVPPLMQARVLRAAERNDPPPKRNRVLDHAYIIAMWGEAPTYVIAEDVGVHEGIVRMWAEELKLGPNAADEEEATDG